MTKTLPTTQEFALALFEQELGWAAEIARNVHRKLPPSFELDDLVQEAHIELWAAAQEFDPHRPDGTPFHGFCYRRIRGAVLMKVRRRHWIDHTLEELVTAEDEDMDALAAVPEPAVSPVDFIEEDQAAREAAARIEASPLVQWLRVALEELPAVDRYVLTRVFIDGVPEADIAATWQVPEHTIQRRALSALARLRRVCKGGQ